MTKGVGFINVRAFASARFGEASWQRVLRALTSDEQLDLLEIIPMGWYDLALYARLIRVLDREFGKGDLSLLEQLGRYEATKDLTTLHRLFMRVANPGLILAKTTQLWRRFHDTGSWDVVREDKSATGTLHQWGVVDAALCAELTGYIRGIIEVGAGKGVTVRHTQCRALGNPACVFAGQWR